METPLKEFMAELPPPKQRRLRPYEIKDRIIIMHKMVETPVALFAVPTYYDAPILPRIKIPEPKHQNPKEKEKHRPNPKQFWTGLLTLLYQSYPLDADEMDD